MISSNHQGIGPRIVRDDSVDLCPEQPLPNPHVIHSPGEYGNSASVTGLYQGAVDNAVLKRYGGGSGLVEPGTEPVRQKRTKPPQSERDNRSERPPLRDTAPVGGIGETANDLGRKLAQANELCSLKRAEQSLALEALPSYGIDQSLLAAGTLDIDQEREPFEPGRGELEHLFQRRQLGIEAAQIGERVLRSRSAGRAVTELGEIERASGDERASVEWMVDRMIAKAAREGVSLGEERTLPTAP